MEVKIQKILVIYPSASHPSHNGSRSILVDYTSYLQEIGHDVYFMCVSDSVSLEEMNLMKEYWGDRLIIYSPPYYKWYKRFFKYLRRWVLLTKEFNVDDWYPLGLGEKVLHYHSKYHFDIVWVNYIWFSKLFEKIPNAKKVLYVHDVFTERFTRTGVDWFSTTKDQEKKALDRADLIAVLQDEEASFLRSITDKPVLSVFGKFNIKSAKIVKNKNILFFGSSNNHNIEAVKWFIDNVLAKLKAIDNEIDLVVGGSICGALQSYSGIVTLIGRVENIEDFYALGNIAINPVFHGTGLKIKTFEALAHGKLLITHSHNIIGVPFREKLPVLIAENEAEYCSAILAFIDDSVKLTHNLEATKVYMDRFNHLFEERFNTILSA